MITESLQKKIDKQTAEYESDFEKFGQIKLCVPPVRGYWIAITLTIAALAVLAVIDLVIQNFDVESSIKLLMLAILFLPATLGVIVGSHFNKRKVVAELFLTHDMLEIKLTESAGRKNKNAQYCFPLSEITADYDFNSPNSMYFRIGIENSDGILVFYLQNMWDTQNAEYVAFVNVVNKNIGGAT